MSVSASDLWIMVSKIYQEYHNAISEISAISDKYYMVCYGFYNVYKQFVVKLIIKVLRVLTMFILEDLERVWVEESCEKQG